jgi:predicted  nucleic acid-binding Zn-ribbon protein
MLPPIVSLRSFLERIGTISFIQRLFSWKKIRNELIDAAASLSSIDTELTNLYTTKIQLENELSGCRKDVRLLEEQKIRLEESQKRWNELVVEKDNRIADLSGQLTTANANCKNLEGQTHSLKTELAEIKESLRQLQQNLKEAREECIHLKKEEDARKTDHSKAMDTFQKWREQIQAERNREIEEKQEAELERLKELKQTWNNHEQNVKARIKSLCQKLTIEYADSVPFRGTPDNAIRLANEYIVFDAKSPGGDDPGNFPSYLKEQAEKAKKYAKQDGVKKDIFFVVPSNTLEVTRQTVFALGDFDVYIVSVDVLEPLLLCLQKIETYEFAEQLTPEERENICRIIGRFTHLTKRRIQIDSFFAKQFMEMVLKCDSDLPDEIKKEVAAFEKAEKLNPPGDRRTKTIDNKQLQNDVNQLSLEIESKGVATDDLSEELNRVRLYKTD